MPGEKLKKARNQVLYNHLSSIMLHDVESINSIDIDSYTVEITFDDGSTGLVNLGFAFNNPKPMAAEVLAGDMFDKCVVLDGTITWPNGYDISPDILYAKLVGREPNGNLIDRLKSLSIKVMPPIQGG